MEQCRAHFPSAFRWAQWSPCNDGTLVTEEETILSTRGVQRGDPLGPFLFAVGLYQVLKDIPPDVLNRYSLDDGLPHGSLAGLDRLLGWLQPKLQTIDLSLNLAKCHVFTRGETSHLPNLREVPVSGDGFEFLGAPISTAQYVQGALSSKFGKAIAFCEQVARLKDQQINLALLQRCAGVCRVLHLLKVVPPDIILPFCQRLDANYWHRTNSALESVCPRTRVDRQFSQPATVAWVFVRVHAFLPHRSFAAYCSFDPLASHCSVPKLCYRHHCEISWKGSNIFVSACLRARIKHGCGLRTRPVSTAAPFTLTSAHCAGGRNRYTSRTRRICETSCPGETAPASPV